MTNKYRFSTLDGSLDKAVRDEYLRNYRINLTLEDLEQGKDLAKIAYVDIRMVPLSSLYEDMEIIIDENSDSFDTIGSLIHLEEIDMDKIEYCNGEEEDEELLKAMYRSLEKSDFHPMGTDGRHFYKNMFEQGLDEYAYEDDFEE